MATRDRGDQRYPQNWVEVERQFPGSSAAFDRDLGDQWLDGRDGPRFDVYGPVLHVFVGESHELGHAGPWASAYFDAERERWVIKTDHREVSAALARLRWTMTWADGEGPEGELDLVRGRDYVVGRSSDCEIRTADRRVSRRHARICWRGDTLHIIDLTSANGTTVNGEAIDELRLEHGSVVRCGDLVIRFSAR